MTIKNPKLDMLKIMSRANDVSVGEKIVLAFILSSINSDEEIKKNLSINGLNASRGKELKIKILHFINNHIPTFAPLKSIINRAIVKQQTVANERIIGIKSGGWCARGAFLNSIELYFAQFGVTFPAVNKNNRRKLADNLFEK